MASHLAPSPDALSRDLDGEILLLDLRSSHYFGLTGTAARIWQLIEAGEDPESIPATLAAEYDADETIIKDEVTAFLDDLVGRGLLVARQP
jgi:hypothetical protein